MKRVFEYLEHHVNLGVAYILNKKDDIHKMFLDGFVDADFAGDSSAKSTTGFLVALTGVFGTFLLLDWCSRLQNNAAKSTGEAEITAINDLLCRSYLNLTYVFEYCFRLGRKRIHSDSAAAIGAVRNGVSVQMRYIRKHQKVSIAFLHDAVKNNEIEIVKAETNSHFVDSLTKPLNREKFESFRMAMHIG